MRCGNRNPFCNRYDSGQVGWIVLSRATALREMPNFAEDTWRQWAINQMEKEVKEYNYYLTGEVYGYILYKKEHGTWVRQESTFDVYPLTLAALADEVGLGLELAIQNGTCQYGIATPVVYTKYQFD